MCDLYILVKTLIAFIMLLDFVLSYIFFNVCKPLFYGWYWQMNCSAFHVNFFVFVVGNTMMTRCALRMENWIWMGLIIKPSTCNKPIVFPLNLQKIAKMAMWVREPFKPINLLVFIKWFRFSPPFNSPLIS